MKKTLMNKSVALFLSLLMLVTSFGGLVSAGNDTHTKVIDNYRVTMETIPILLTEAWTEPIYDDVLVEVPYTDYKTEKVITYETYEDKKYISAASVWYYKNILKYDITSYTTYTTKYVWEKYTVRKKYKSYYWSGWKLMYRYKYKYVTRYRRVKKSVPKIKYIATKEKEKKIVTNKQVAFTNYRYEWQSQIVSNIHHPAVYIDGERTIEVEPIAKTLNWGNAYYMIKESVKFKDVIDDFDYQKEKIYKFSPFATGYYTIETVANSGDGVSGMLIGEDINKSSSGSSINFSNVYLQKGKVYTINVMPINNKEHNCTLQIFFDHINVNVSGDYMSIKGEFGYLNQGVASMNGNNEASVKFFSQDLARAELEDKVLIPFDKLSEYGIKESHVEGTVIGVGGIVLAIVASGVAATAGGVALAIVGIINPIQEEMDRAKISDALLSCEPGDYIVVFRNYYTGETIVSNTNGNTWIAPDGFYITN